jgi:hypothetical protein
LKKPADMIIHVLHNTRNYRLKEIAQSERGGIRLVLQSILLPRFRFFYIIARLTVINFWSSSSESLCT